MTCIILCTCILLSQYKNLTDVKDEVLSRGCHKGDLECVKIMINKYDCDPKGLLSITLRYIKACCLFCVIKLLNVNLLPYAVSKFYIP